MHDDIEIRKEEFLLHYKKIYSFLREKWDIKTLFLIKDILKRFLLSYDKSALTEMEEEIWSDIRTAIIAIEEVGLKQSTVLAILLLHPVSEGSYSIDKCKNSFGEETAIILKGFIKIREFSDKKTAVESENYIKLLLSIAEDIRVVFMMIAQHLRLMREAKSKTSEERLNLSIESTYLYAPLAHRLGLYTIKSELEDLSLKYTDRETYDFIARKLNETKRSRDRYIHEFIEPLKGRLDGSGFNYEIKGRTKSIFSIYNKLKKQKIEFENIYDLFAIRVILDAPEQEEKAQCW